jgi:hypothetical protein
MTQEFRSLAVRKYGGLDGKEYQDWHCDSGMTEEAPVYHGGEGVEGEG